MFKYIILIITFLVTSPVYAASIDTTNKWAWGDVLGFINWDPAHVDVDVTDTEVTGSIWSQNYGWIHLQSINTGVTNTCLGDLSGYAWGDAIGYIDMSDVSVDPATGIFSGTGHALNSSFGEIYFTGLNIAVQTDWRCSVASLSSGGGGGGGRSYSCKDPEANNYKTTGFSRAELCTYDKEPIEEKIEQVPVSEEYTPEETTEPVIKPVVEEKIPDSEAPQEEYIPTTYIPYPNQFTFPKLLPQTGTPLLERTRVITNPKVDTSTPDWFQPSMNEDIEYWKHNVLPFAEDRDEDEYIVVPSLGVIVPVNYVPRESSDYYDITKDGTQIKDFSLQGGKNYLKYLDDGIMQYPGTLPIGLSAGENKEYTGNTVIFGHSSYWKNNNGKYDTIFGLLPTLDVGEEIWIFTRKNSHRLDGEGIYELRKHSIKKSYETNPNDTQVLSQTGYDVPHVTLFTCTPIGGISGRWIVQAELIEVKREFSSEDLIREKVREENEALEEQILLEEDKKYGEVLSRYLRDRVRNIIDRMFTKIGVNNHEKLKILLLERLDALNEKYVDDYEKGVFIEYIVEQVEEK